ncbi:hypothetical protein CAEBREN_25477 [Caenorhabditis brenneri]|uniref:Uncharacterized protein n=1 Tax=Caenorhabditis brenneri TaxID=135651 RepID=G0N685_CAEBE|nr:hypothetical protein CAEBREN_25477 [Caenorhabditis brenneri]
MDRREENHKAMLEHEEINKLDERELMIAAGIFDFIGMRDEVLDRNRELIRHLQVLDDDVVPIEILNRKNDIVRIFEEASATLVQASMMHRDLTRFPRDFSLAINQTLLARISDLQEISSDIFGIAQTNRWDERISETLSALTRIHMRIPAHQLQQNQLESLRALLTRTEVLHRPAWYFQFVEAVGNKLEKIRGIYHEKEEEMQDEFDRRQQHLRQEMYKQEHITILRKQEHFDIIQSTHLTTVEKLVANIDELIMKNTELKMKTNRNHKEEDVKSDPKPNESSDTRLDLQIINSNQATKVGTLVLHEFFFSHVTAHGRIVLQEIKKQFLGAKKHDFGYVLLNFMRVEGNIKSMKVYLGNQLIGIHQYTKKKLGLTSKMRKKEPNAIQWHKNNAKTKLESIKQEMKFLGWDVETIYRNKDLCIHLIFLAYHVFSFQYNNQELALSGNPSFLLEEKDFLDRIEYYKTTAKEYLNKFNRLELTDPLATD